ncbi:hypothetical protein [Streptomyces marianii]|uniref:ATP/GTP-binding protein n=1 Tax=Streptomyces marianii TaxID=1817406 RepID=A0A5R9DQT6_9ACTN|nr:hypothetical protein [Streptomyces marianii]TLQ38630.1 hypothetical protein FEF34_40855 [Streptomyces marianii]
MIRLPSNHVAITAPLVAADMAFPGIEIGRSTTDGRPFHLTPVLVDYDYMQSTNSITLGGLGSGKSTSRKVQVRRSILHHGAQAVVIDSYGEQKPAEALEGEWAPLTRSLGGQVVMAGEFTLNPCSPMFPADVREQLIRSLIATVEPTALTPESGHALQHALNNPKATDLGGLVDALQDPEDGRFPAAELTAWGIRAVLALSKFTEGALRGLFDGPTAGLPDTDLPIVSFDFTRMDKSSPAIPALMAAISCWVEHVWIRQSTARHRHFVIEEAWQIFLSPHTNELIQRLIKNSRKDRLSVDAVMHTLSDLGDGRAQDAVRLATIVQVGRLTPDEAAQVGALYNLPAWAVEKIPTLAPGEAVWKVGDTFVDIIQTVITDEEAKLTDTSAGRRAAQEAEFGEQVTEETGDDEEEPALSLDKDTEPTEDVHDVDDPAGPDDDGWGFELPPNTIDTVYTGQRLDHRHQAVLQAARAGRLNEAADLAAVGEREDITTHGFNSPQATAWLVTRAEVAELSGNKDQAAHLRATVARMGNNGGAEWFERTDDTEPQWHQVSEPPPAPEPTSPDDDHPRARRRTWPYVAAVAALAITAAGIWQSAEDDTQREERRQKVSAYKGRSGAALSIDSVDADVVAQWARDRRSVIVELRTGFEPDARYLRIDSGEKSAVSQPEEGRFAVDPELRIPVKDPYADVTVRVVIGGKGWKEGSRASSRAVRLSPTGVAFDAETGKRLPSDL